MNKNLSDLYSSFSCNPVILYIGKNISDNDLQQYILKLPWSCIITSRSDGEFMSLLSSQSKKIRIYTPTSTEKFPSSPIEKDYISIFRIFGEDGENDDTDGMSAAMLSIFGEDDNDASDKYKLDNACEMLRILIPKCLDGLTQIIFVGYDDSCENEIPLIKLAKIVLSDKVPDSCIQFWGINCGYKIYEQIKKICDIRKFTLIEEPLEKAIRENDTPEDYTTIVSYSDYSNDIFYSAGETIDISQQELENFSDVAMLVTNNKINSIRPNGKYSYQNWFFNFLNQTPVDGPQWYGYNKRSEFYVKRNFYSNLEHIVDSMLNGSIKIDQSGPIILAGHSCSSKTVTLGALAYNKFIEKKNPVIYIKNESIAFYDGSDELKALENLIQTIEDKTEKKARILIIWDCSFYRDVERTAVRLFNRLRGQGRRFVILCSAYPTSNVGVSTEYYKFCEKQPLSKGTSDNYDYSKKGSCYFVSADREMNEKEIASFWTIFNNYSGIKKDVIKYWKCEKLADKNDIFEYYYKMVTLLRQNLENRLMREDALYRNYISNVFDDILENNQNDNEKNLSPIQSAFAKAKIPLPDKYKNITSESSWTRTDELFILIAMFSKFKLEVPYRIVYQVLTNFSDSKIVFSTENKKIFDALTKIPLFHYGDSERMNGFTFRFRNSLEALLFLNKKDPRGEMQFNLICKVIDILIKDYENVGIADETLIKNICDFLRLSGPNSAYFEDETYKDWSKEYFKKNIPTLISKIKDAINTFNNINDKIGFIQTYVTFTREYYFNYLNSLEKQNNTTQELPAVDVSISERIGKLMGAYNLAKETIESISLTLKDNSPYINKPYLNDEYQSLSVESSLIYLHIQKLCQDNKKEGFENDCVKIIFRFQEVYNILKKIIYQNPTNGYAYNALFRNFEYMYENESNKETKIRYLSYMLQIINNSNEQEISNRGANNDELSEHITKIYDYCAETKITLDGIINRVESYENGELTEFYKYYDEWLNANNPVAIVFVCLKYLREKDVFCKDKKESSASDNAYEITEEKLNACKKVIDFMSNEENFSAVCNSADAISLLIRVTWLYFNHSPLTGSKDRQMTKLNMSQWKDILDLCSIYNAFTEEEKQPIIVLLYALSIIQVKREYVEANRILATVNENRFYNTDRIRSPFMLCGEDGNPIEFKGGKVICAVNETTGYISVNGIPEELGNKRKGVYFKLQNLGKEIKMPKINEWFRDNIEISIGYLGLTAYTKAGREKRGDHK